MVPPQLNGLGVHYSRVDITPANGSECANLDDLIITSKNGEAIFAGRAMGGRPLHHHRIIDLDTVMITSDGKTRSLDMFWVPASRYTGAM